jgi:hypothetical protein
MAPRTAAQKSDAPAGLDLASLDLAPSAEAGATMQLLHPVSAEPLGITMEVMGQDAPTYRKNLRKLRDMLAKQGEDDEDEDPDKRDLTRIARLSACAVRGWAGVQWKGQDLPYSFENAVMVFAALPWISEQVGFFRDRRANFFKD